MTELQSVVCNDTRIMMFRKFITVEFDTWHTKTSIRQRAGTDRHFLARPDAVWWYLDPYPVPLKLVNFRPKPGPYGSGLLAPGPCRGLLAGNQQTAYIYRQWCHEPMTMIVIFFYHLKRYSLLYIAWQYMLQIMLSERQHLSKEKPRQCQYW